MISGVVRARHRWPLTIFVQNFHFTNITIYVLIITIKETLYFLDISNSMYELLGMKSVT